MSIEALDFGLAASTGRTLIDDLLAEQQRMGAVDRFSQKRHFRPEEAPAQARHYLDLIPICRPQTGEQFAFAVDLDACTGCKACVSACHSLNGLDEDEIWRNVGLLHGGTQEAPYQQTVTTACHHCADPACLNGCPVLAYEKDRETGIVRHLDDQCIGCQYCMLKCPYDVPKYSKSRGIVRKCDMCYQRLAVGEAPACVQACPSMAIQIRIVSQADLVATSSGDRRLLPGAFVSSYTKPCTSFLTRRQIPANACAGDEHQLTLAAAHWPLIGMLLLTQLSTGIFAAVLCEHLTSRAPALPGDNVILGIALAALFAGLGVSVLHLGRPLGAWRAFLGLRRSWMSREIVAFTVFAGLAGAYVVPRLAAAVPPRFLPSLLEESLHLLASWNSGLEVATAFTGALAVVCSAMIYVDTRRPFWGAAFSFPRFFGASGALGMAAVAALRWAVPAPPIGNPVLCALAICVALALTSWEGGVLLRALWNSASPIHRSAKAAVSFLSGWAVVRTASCALLAGIGLFLVARKPSILPGGAALPMVVFLLILLSQTIERYGFFTAVDAPRMPGGAGQ